MKLDPTHRLEIIAELERKTKYTFEFLNPLTDEQLLKLYKERS
ncbi:hypothetical protein SAMN05877753_1238 [Bacillus oleivorans]|uniref:Fur-regulated basic protein A n=1 Tax=Bacillus oleivorans TaxID=1448271 RepID=A0A285D8L4_9BACI|nr:hypothetical protein [Bacillus oleivorans]SNX75955.1 hypothetical protein SAMN05877753_1238 [Bacillus oleivorans]